MCGCVQTQTQKGPGVLFRVAQRSTRLEFPQVPSPNCRYSSSGSVPILDRKGSRSGKTDVLYSPTTPPLTICRCAVSLVQEDVRTRWRRGSESEYTSESWDLGYTLTLRRWNRLRTGKGKRKVKSTRGEKGSEDNFLSRTLHVKTKHTVENVKKCL